MKASDYVTQQLLGENEAYGARFESQPRVSVTVRLPVELVAWLDVLKSKGLGDSRNAVLQVLLDVGIDDVKNQAIFDVSDLEDMVQAVQEQYILKLEDQA